MTGNENIKAGDILVCISNEGLSSVGNKVTVFGITEKSVNTNGSHTGWTNRDNFRWHCYRHVPCNVPDERVLKFLERQKEVRENNKIILEQRRKELEKENFYGRN